MPSKSLDLGAPLVGLTVLLLSCLACEETPKPAATQPSAAPAPVASGSAPASSEPASEPAKPNKPRKKLEDCPKGAEIKFDSPEIEQAVRFKLQKTGGVITKADLTKLKSLNLSQIEGLQELDICLFAHAKQLKELFLGRGEIDDLSPIAGLTQLETLRASMNPIKDIGPLEKMTKMDRLDLALTQVSDLTPLAGMTELTFLMLDNTQVEDLTPLGKLTKLERLDVQRTKVKDFRPLAGLKSLKFLYVSGCPGELDAATHLGALAQGGLRIMTD